MTEVCALLHKGNANYGISFPDFPGCISGGKTAEEAIARGREALAFHVAGLIEDGPALPRVRAVEDLQSDPCLREDFEAGVVALVPVEFPR
ncbi:MAG TPA: type II toxin-antitoxin system HicB family antitoxin [Methylovirgula sp.]